MKKLYLLRHAQAEKGAGKGDFERELTPVGQLQAKLVGEYLATNNIVPDLILCSDALRTRQTLNLIKEAGKLPSKIIYLHELYNASTDTLVQQVMMTDEMAGSLMIVGHNPAITTLSFKFKLQEGVENISDFNPTGKLVGLEFDKAPWSNLLMASCRVINWFCP